MPKQKKQASYFTKPLTKKSARQQVRTVRRLALGPQDRLLKGEARASKLRGKQIKDWFPQHAEEIDKVAADTAAAYGQAAGSVNAQSAASADYAEKLRQRLATEGAADAKLRGATYTPSTVGADASLARINSANILSSVIAGQGASQAGYLANKGLTAKREKIEQLLKEGDVRKSISGERKDLAREGRDIVRDEMARLKDDERDYLLARGAARLDKRGQNTQIQVAKQYGKNTRKEQAGSLRNQLAVSRAQAGNARADDARSRRYARRFGGAGKDKPGISVGEAASMIRQNFPLKKIDSAQRRQDVLDYLKGSRSVDAATARKALQRVLRSSGSVNPAINPNASGPPRPRGL